MFQGYAAVLVHVLWCHQFLLASVSKDMSENHSFKEAKIHWQCRSYQYKMLLVIAHLKNIKFCGLHVTQQ